MVRGYTVESGFKYGCDFILYRQTSNKHEHGEIVVLVHHPDSCEPIQCKMTSFVRLASIVHKKAYFVYMENDHVVSLVSSYCRFIFYT